MPTDRFARLKKQKKEHILKSASRIFALYDYSSINIIEIAEEAGISRGSFYLYFTDKSDCFNAVVDAHKERIALEFNKIIAEAKTVTEVIMSTFDYISHFSKFERGLFNKIVNHSNLNDSDIVYEAYKGSEYFIGAKLRKILQDNGSNIGDNEEKEIALIAEMIYSFLLLTLIEFNASKGSNIETLRAKLSEKLDMLLTTLSKMYKCKII